MFENFTLERIDVGEAELRVRHGGSGPPVLLLHGHPRTHTTWHRVAPLLATDHTVVCPDLRGYGESSKPPTDPEHEPYSKRAMARDCVALMRTLGHERFAVVGHDRGGYVATRLTLDHPAAVTKLVVMDGVPIGAALARCDAKFAASWWHWFFFGQTEKPAERVINADPDAWYLGEPDTTGRGELRRLPAGHPRPGDRARDVRGLPGRPRHRPRPRRRGPGGGQPRSSVRCSPSGPPRTTCPICTGTWSRCGSEWADDVRGQPVDSGHHMAEEAPEELAAILRGFLAGRP